MTGLLKPSSAVKSDRCGGLGFCQFSKPAPGPGYEVSQHLSFHVCKVEKSSWSPGMVGCHRQCRAGGSLKGSPATGRDFARPVLRPLRVPGAPQGRRG